jgi:hypothetical protein
MAVAKENIKRTRGDTKDMLLYLKKDGIPFPMVSFAAILSVSIDSAPTEAVYVFQSVAIVDGVLGTLTFPFTVDDVDYLGDFYYDVQVTDDLGKISTVLKGKLTFEQDITK